MRNYVSEEISGNHFIELVQLISNVGKNKSLQLHNSFLLESVQLQCAFV